MATKTPFNAPDRTTCPYSPSDSKAMAVIKFLTYSRSRSLPENQFKDQVSALIEKEKRAAKSPAHCKHPIHHAEIVKKNWIEQGIWNPNWKKYEPGPEWLHEAPPRLTTVELATASLAERAEVSERLADFKDKSRPWHQFLYQVRQTQQRNSEEFFEQQTRPGVPLPKDTFSVAYEEVKQIWQERHIWQKEWTVLPGITWMHEYSLETVLRDALGDDCVDNCPDVQNAIKADKQRENDAIKAGIAEFMKRDRTHPNPTWAAVEKATGEERSNKKRKTSKAFDKESKKTTTPAAPAQKPPEVEQLKSKQVKKVCKELGVSVRRSPRLLELERREGAKNYRIG